MEAVHLSGRDPITEEIEGQLSKVLERIAAVNEIRAEASIELSLLTAERDRLFRNLAHRRRTEEGGGRAM